MDFFSVLAFVLLVALLAAAYKREKLVDGVAYSSAVKFFIIGVAVRYPIHDLIYRDFHGPAVLIWFGADVAGYILLLLSFRSLCMALGAPLPKKTEGETWKGGL